MPSIRYDVPLEAQDYDYSCWHTAAYMVWLYWQQNGYGAGPMNTLSGEYNQAKTQGLSPAKFVTLGKTTGLRIVPQKATPYTEGDLYVTLKKYGPLWAAGYWEGEPHVVTITGVEKGFFFYNNPDGGVAEANDIAAFNSKRAKLAGALLAKDPNAY